MSSLAISSWQGLLANQQSQLARNAKSPSVTQALDYFNQKAPQITSVDQLMRDQKLLNIVLTSYGLESEMQYPARLRTLLTQDPSNQSSLVNQLVDPRYSKLVADLSFANGPPAALKDPTFQAKFAQTYATTVFEKNLGTQDPALREAAYFMRNIGNVTSVYQILSDTVLRDVTTHALQLPDGFGMLDITQQASILTQRLNLSTLQSSLAANSTLYQNATDDQGQITNAANLAKAASGVVNNLTNGLTAIQAAYASLSTRQDPSGPNAANIATQNAYVPDLTRVLGLLGAADVRTAGLAASIGSLQQLVQAAPGADAATLATYKSQFDQTVARLKTDLDGATYTDPTTGTTSNLLENASLSITITLGPGNSHTFSGTDLTSIKTSLDSAQSQFDALSVGSTPGGTIASDLSSASSGAATATSFVAQQKQLYNSALQGADPSISASQQALVYRAASSATDSLQRSGTLASKLVALQADLTIGADTSFTDRASLDADVQQLKTDITNLIANSQGGTDNLLTAEGNYGSEAGVLLAIPSADLQAQIADKLANVNALSASNSQNGADLITNVLQPLLATQTRALSSAADYVQQVAASAPFAVTVDTQQMSRGSASAADGLSRMTQLGDLLGQLQTLAQQAITSGGDASLNAQSAGLQSQIGTLINTAASGADNLLTGTGAQGYTYVAGSKLYLRNTDLGTKVTNALAGLDLSTASGAQAAYNLITATVLPSLADARSSLTSDAQALDSARATFDPRTAIDNQFTSIVNNISNQVATATVGSSNLLTSVADTLVFLKSSPDMYDISGHGEFDSRVTQPLTSAVDALRTGASPPASALQQAIDALTNISIDLSGDASRMQFGTQSVTDLTAQKSQAEQAQVTTPYQGTRAAKLLVMQYLALAQDSAPSQAASLADLFGGTPSTDNILNLLA